MKIVEFIFEEKLKKKENNKKNKSKKKTKKGRKKNKKKKKRKEEENELVAFSVCSNSLEDIYLLFAAPILLFWNSII